MTFVVHISASAEEDYLTKRAALVKEIKLDVRYSVSLTGHPKLNEKVVTAMMITPRHQFVPFHLRTAAYENRPLPIGHGQTISQPFIVAIMTELLELEEDDVVLEVGTGSGYQAAILSSIVNKVYTVEIIEPLFKESRDRLRKLKYVNVNVRYGDGYYGLPEIAPFNAIIVTAATNHIPPPLIQQLSPGGKMAIPVGDRFTTQQLILVEKNADGKIVTKHILPVIFVPLTGEH